MIGHAAATIALISVAVHGVFFYADFNETLGLTLNGNSATTNCIFKPINAYGVNYAAADVLEALLDVIQSHSLDRVTLDTTETSTPAFTKHIASTTAMFGHRDTYQPSLQSECPVRVRLTGSQPHQASSVWYNDPLNVLDGFETRFTFQISDHAKRCYDVKTPNFGLTSYQSCVVHGGDGFAFVVHGDPNATFALGASGQGLGWSSISPALAVVFHTGPNGGSPTSDALLVDHVSLHASSNAPGNPPLLLSAPVPVDIADGTIHIVKVRYYNSMPQQYFAYLSSAPDAVPFMKDMSEERRVGCVVVFMDDGINSDTPLFAVPINLAVALILPNDQAYIGFTAATGHAWEKHDVLSWYYCAAPPCLNANGAIVALDFDYETQSKLNAASYGTGLYPELIFPDTGAWGLDQAYFAPQVPRGVS
ncbi:hypothetical protein H310_06654 [Aphanomyces invadans]|uniref:Legume lectin domain-containing protein n=1 Tax=Aphanomyces invadans TaxID=157072 RepID=A0A024U454_9STRA|nr:hypothetical protein H310_06654 [Aphanomyces invadans]ETW01019.1 hypothetical protein H310_06654 [Aphanomyces invadans]|eukprot:XP_008870017.1 hypothetical protein H310_06654 [Aphanomyces invadans]